MRFGPIELPLPTLVLVVLALALGTTLVVGATTSADVFGPFNPEWEGLSELRDEADAADVELLVATETDRYETVDPGGTVALIIAPEEYTSADRERIRDFVERGGTVVVAGREPASTNPLLTGLGTELRVDGDPLRDEEHFYRSPAFPVVTNATDHPYVASADGLSFNHGTAIEVAGANATVLAWSSEYSYLDRDGDDALGDDEELAERPMIALQDVGAGAVVVVSDPSVFINAMLDRDANRALVAGLLANHDRLLLDHTTTGVPPLVLVLLTLREWPLLAGLVGMAGVALVVGWERRSHRWLGARLRLLDGQDERDASGITEAQSARDPAALEAYLEERHPEWDDGRRKRVLDGIITVREKSRDNDRRG